VFSGDGFRCKKVGGRGEKKGTFALAGPI